MTLVEILLVLALIGTLTTALLIASPLAGWSLEQKGLEDQLREAIQTARFHAAENKETVRLDWDAETETYRLRDLNGNPIETLDVEVLTEGEPRVIWEVVVPGEGMPTGSLNNPQYREAESILFAPDRSTTPFIVTLEEPGLERRQLRFDSFSSVEIRDAPES